MGTYSESGQAGRFSKINCEEAFQEAYSALLGETECLVYRGALAAAVVTYVRAISQQLKAGKVSTPETSGILACIENMTLALAKREGW